MKKRKYWYYFTYYQCVVGDTEGIDKERRYTKKPKLWINRHKVVDYICGNH